LAWLRRHHREVVTGEIPEVRCEPAPFVDLRHALMRLSPKQRAVVVLHYYEGLGETEIAGVLGCRPGSIGPLLTRARRRLRREWSDAER
jgi:RNA polymerase sigma-70 factor (ECF subfamily)